MASAAVASARLASASPRLVRPTASSLAAHACCQGRIRPSPSAATHRLFSISPALQKKRKAEVGAPARRPGPDPSSSSSSNSASASSSKHPKPDPDQPLDFSSLQAAYAPIDAHHKAQLQAMLHGGRFNPSQLGALPVPLPSAGSGGGDQTFPLLELAQIVTRPGGRSVSLLVNERAYIKPIMSAVQASRDFNQQPQRSDENELELVLRVEMERPDDAARRVRDVAQAWRERLRQARTRHEKVLKEWKQSGKVLPDVFRRADKELQKVQDKKMKEVDQVEAQTLSHLERNSP